MINIAINGSSGRMGRAIKDVIQNDNTLALTTELTRHNNTIPQTTHVVIDFSSQEGLQNLLLNAQCPIISGTTGLDDHTLSLMKKYGKEKNGIIWGSNTSFGVNLMFALVKKLGSLLDIEYDAEIHERHHRMKKDAPSGTALTMGKKICEGRGSEFKKNNYSKFGERKHGDIGFAVERGGKTVGYHEARFISDNETIWLGHEAHDRSIFAKGAVKLAKMLVNKNIKGYHEACDILLD